MFALTGYFFRRHWKKLAIFVAVTFALSLYTLFFLQGALPATTQIQNTGAGLQVTQTVKEIKIYDDPAYFFNLSLLQFFVAAMAVWIVWRERRFLATLSFTRLGILWGSFGFLLVLSLVIAACSLILPALGRGILWACGFRLQREWSVNVVLTGGMRDWWKTPLSVFAECVLTAGVWTLFGAIWVRWWKPLLVLGAIGIGFIILLASQIHWLSMLGSLEEWARSFVLWVFDEAIPRLVDFANRVEEQYWQRLLLCLGAGFVAALLSYPVTRWMKIIK